MQLTILLTIFCLLLSTEARIRKNRNLQANEDVVRLLVTYRDFLPAGCARDLAATGSAPADIRAAATNLDLEQRAAMGSGNQANPNNCLDLTNNPFWQQALGSGVVKGHPDFNVITQTGIAQLCINQGFFPEGTCRFAPGFPEFHEILDLNLQENSAGIPKPVYCRPGATDSCGFTTNGLRQSSQKQFFDSWFNDDLQFNKKIAQPLDLIRQEPGSNLFVFNSNGGNDSPASGNDVTPGFFGPLGRFKISGNPDFVGINDFNDPKDFPAWPRAFGSDIGFWMTTEVHITFEYFEDEEMVFRFTGDDDYWAFFNGQLAIDLQGIHGAASAQIDLNGLSNGVKIADLLGLVNGNTYNLDIFHAERNVVGSNFDITTSLVPACNVIQSGELIFDLSNGLTEEEFSGLFFVSPEVSRIDATSFSLSSDEASGSFIFNFFGENFINGFRSTFKAQVAPNSEGFAFLIQNRGLFGYPITTGSTFNIEGVANSYAVVFDFCTNRDDVDFDGTCIGQDVRIHHADAEGQFNSANDATKRVFDEIIRSDGRKFQEFNVEVIFFGESPNFVEVYIDDSLVLREKDIDLRGIIGNGAAYIGFTSSSGDTGGSVTISDFALSTIVVDPLNSEFSVKADSLFQAGAFVEFDLQTFDFCGNLVTAGGEGEFIQTFFIEQVDEVTGTYAENRFQPDIQAGFVVDNVDGTYDVDFLTNFPGVFKVFVAFGETCSLDLSLEDQEGIQVADVTFVGEPADCLFFEQQIVLETPAPTLSPTSNPTSSPTPNPTSSPTPNPTSSPTANPTTSPTSNPTGNPTSNPTGNPTSNPTGNPTFSPTSNPTFSPTSNPTVNPTSNPTVNPTGNPTISPTTSPTFNPTTSPTFNPTGNPTFSPTFNPTGNPTFSPTFNPTTSPTFNPTSSPTELDEADNLEDVLAIGIPLLIIILILIILLLCRCRSYGKDENEDDDVYLNEGKEDIAKLNL